jgi:sterol desaturase/sphingolipid hydroxylase (fatty acid hydroxylase superfamily)
MELSLSAQHTQISWRLGPMYRVFMTPTFHSYHHSTDPQHHNKNFSGGVFSFWDYIFGTAVKDTQTPPGRLGLENLHMGSLWSMLVMPFQLLLMPSRSIRRNARKNGIPH